MSRCYRVSWGLDLAASAHTSQSYSGKQVQYQGGQTYSQLSHQGSRKARCLFCTVLMPQQDSSMGGSKVILLPNLGHVGGCSLGREAGTQWWKQVAFASAPEHGNLCAALPHLCTWSPALKPLTSYHPRTSTWGEKEGQGVRRGGTWEQAFVA